MEGRTIARPNQLRPTGPRPHSSGFNGGPDNCPAKRAPLVINYARRYIASMEGRTIARPNFFCAERLGLSSMPLQWRAGQLPGQTHIVEDVPHTVTVASMEGRTIARPNTADQRRGRADHRASMEGRTIARPNDVCGRPLPCRYQLQWRAGQLPGQTLRGVRAARRALRLQWRAGQLPGQTLSDCPPRGQRRRGFNGGPDNCPAKLGPGTNEAVVRVLASMEGRTIARPNGTMWSRCRGLPAWLQWRAGQLPGQTRAGKRTGSGCCGLQWRAGQLPGQTPTQEGNQP